MRDLLPYFESELTFLRQRGQAFAQAFPRIAGQLHLGADEAKDPHVERMIESFALLAARVHKRLDDDFPLFTESLLEVLYPQYLRPFPSCSIAQFDLMAASAQLSAPMLVARGTPLMTRPVQGLACRFQTSQDVTLLPLRLSEASYRNALTAPAGTRMVASATSVLSLRFELESAQISWRKLSGQVLRFYLDGEPSLVSVLREALCRHVVGVMHGFAPHAPWREARAVNGLEAVALPQLSGFAEEQALLPQEARAHDAYRLLSEYFAFPEKFNFVDITLPEMAADAAPADAGLAGLGREPGGQGASAPRSLTLHLLMSGIRADSDASRLLEALQPAHLKLACTPVVNLFEQAADPIRVKHDKVGYPLVVDGRRAHGYEVYGVERVFRVSKTAQGEQVQRFAPFFALRHDDLGEVASPLRIKASEPAGERAGGRYWFARRDEATAQVSPGYEFELSFVDIDFNPAVPSFDTLSIDVLATNRDLPAQLPFGMPGGDLFMQGGGPAREIRLLRKPTASQRFERGRGALWRLISHLSLNHLSLSAGGIDALKEMLRLYDLPRSASNRRQVDGLIAIDYKPATAWLAGEPYATFVRGTEIRLTVDEDSFVGSGLGLFAALLDHFFALYVHANSFTRLTIISARTQEELISCPPRNGDKPLV